MVKSEIQKFQGSNLIPGVEVEEFDITELPFEMRLLQEHYLNTITKFLPLYEEGGQINVYVNLSKPITIKDIGVGIPDKNKKPFPISLPVAYNLISLRKLSHRVPTELENLVGEDYPEHTSKKVFREEDLQKLADIWKRPIAHIDEKFTLLKELRHDYIVKNIYHPSER